MASDNAGDKQGPIHSGDSTPTLNGRGTPGDTVDVWDNGEKIGSATVDPDGNWTWTPDQPLADGDHSLSTTETDPAGNVSEPSPGLDITVDTTPPDAGALSITGVADDVGEITGNIPTGGKTDDTRPVISGTGTAGDTIILYTTDASGQHEIGRATVDNSGHWSIQIENDLLAGENTFSAVEKDVAGNSTTSGDYTITVYASGPAAPSINTLIDNEGPHTGPLQKGEITDDSTPALHGSAGAGLVVRVYDNGTLLGSTTADASGNWVTICTTAVAVLPLSQA